jgi:hypothetical protein
VYFDSSISSAAILASSWDTYLHAVTVSRSTRKASEPPKFPTVWCQRCGRPTLGGKAHSASSRDIRILLSRQNNWCMSGGWKFPAGRAHTLPCAPCIARRLWRLAWIRGSVCERERTLRRVRGAWQRVGWIRGGRQKGLVEQQWEQRADTQGEVGLLRADAEGNGKEEMV